MVRVDGCGRLVLHPCIHTSINASNHPGGQAYLRVALRRVACLLVRRPRRPGRHQPRLRRLRLGATAGGLVPRATRVPPRRGGGVFEAFQGGFVLLHRGLCLVSPRLGGAPRCAAGVGVRFPPLHLSLFTHGKEGRVRE